MRLCVHKALLTKAFVHILATASLAIRVSTILARHGLTLLKASFNCPSNQVMSYCYEGLYLAHTCMYPLH